MKKIKIGIFGVGHNHGAAAIETLRRDSRAEIVGLCEKDSAILEKRLRENISVYGDIPVMTEEELFGAGLDAAYVEASVPDLVPTALKCAERGLHIHMDKPAGTDLDEYGRLLSLLKEKKLFFQTGYMYRYNAGIRYVLETVKSGKLGRIYNITAQMSTKHPAWFKKQLIGYGVKAPDMFIFGGHLIDLVMQIKGDPEKIHAFHAATGDDGIVFEDTSLAVLHYADGIATARVSSTEVNGWGMREFTVYGEKGTVCVSPIEAPMKIRESLLSESEPWKNREHSVEIPERGRYEAMTEEFLSAVGGDVPYCVNFAHEYQLQKNTLLACGYKIKGEKYEF